MKEVKARPDKWKTDRFTGALMCKGCGKFVITFLGLAMCDCAIMVVEAKQPKVNLT